MKSPITGKEMRVAKELLDIEFRNEDPNWTSIIYARRPERRL